jgi:alkyldihydroxyacetonephosphate synthase
MQSDKYGDISDIARGMRVIMPGKVLEVRPLPHTSTGPSVREMVLGSEGRLGCDHRGHRTGASDP